MPAPKGNKNAVARPGQRRRGAPAGAPRAAGAGRPKLFEPIRLSVDDAALLRSVVGDDLGDALRRIAAAAAADQEGTRTALAPLLEIAAWDGGVL